MHPTLLQLQDQITFLCYRNGISNGFIYKIDNQLLYGSSVKQIGLYFRVYLLRLAKKYCQKRIHNLATQYNHENKSNCNEQMELKQDNCNENKEESHFTQAKNETQEMRNMRLKRDSYILYVKQSDVLITQSQDEIARYNKEESDNAPDCRISNLEEYGSEDKVMIPCNVYFDIEFVNRHLKLDKFEIWGDDEMKKSCRFNSKMQCQLRGLADPIALHLKVGKNNSHVLMETKGIGTVHEIEFPANLFLQPLPTLDPTKIWAYSFSEIQLAQMHLRYQSAVEKREQFFTDWESCNLKLDENNDVRKSRKSKCKPNVNVDGIAMNIINEAFEEWRSANVDMDDARRACNNENQIAMTRMFVQYLKPTDQSTIFQLATPMSQYEDMACDMEPHIIGASGVTQRNSSQYGFVYPSPSDDGVLQMDPTNGLRPITREMIELANGTQRITTTTVNSVQYPGIVQHATSAIKNRDTEKRENLLKQYNILYEQGMLSTIRKITM